MGIITRENIVNTPSISGKIGLIASRFNQKIVEQLIEGAQNAFLKNGVSATQLQLVRVPGAYEIPFAAQCLMQTGKYVGLIALGVVLRGETAHFDYIAGSCAHGLMKVQLKMNIPIVFCVLTTNTIQQAQERAFLDKGNKGAECALSLLEMITLTETFCE